MSKEVTGQNGAIAGTSAYFGALNGGRLIAGFMPDESGYDYHSGLTTLAADATETIAQIQRDLNQHIGILRYIPSERRSRLAQLVTELGQLCSLVEGDNDRAGACLSMLSLSGFAGLSQSMASDWELEEGAEVIRTGGQSGLDAFSCRSVVKEAAEWGEDFAAGDSAEKQLFLHALMGGRNQFFLKDVWDFYNYRENPEEYCGGNGCTFCSEGYLADLESEAFPPERIIGELEDIVGQIETDVLRGQSESDYLTDANGDALIDAVQSLYRCGALGSFNLTDQIKKLCWYTPLDVDKIAALQQSLNRLNLGTPLKIDGVYGEKTSAGWHSLTEALISGALPTLAYIDPLQTKNTGISAQTIQTATGDLIFSLRDNSVRSIHSRNGITVLRADTPDTVHPFYHINTVEGRSIKSGQYAGSPLQQSVLNQFNHMEISEDAYRILSKFDKYAKIVRCAGRVLLVAGVALDALEIGNTIKADLDDADGKIGKSTYSTAASIGGQWALGSLGAKGGAMLGAAIGTAIFPGVGTAVGGILGGLALGIIGSGVGSALGEWVIDITCVEE